MNKYIFVFSPKNYANLRKNGFPIKPRNVNELKIGSFKFTPTPYPF